MSAIHLRNPLSLLQRPKPAWENPEVSIGPFRGVVKGGLKYWDAQGPAQEAYDQICTGIQQVLNSSCGPVRCSSAVVYDIYMVGRDTSTAIPHIMFSCKQSKSRKQAVAAVRESGIMQNCPQIELGHWEYPPHILNLRLLASSGIAEDLDLGDSASHYCLRPIPNPENPSETLAVRLHLSGSTDHRVGTIGSVTEHNGKLFYVVPQHIFSAPGSTPYPTDEDSELEDDSDYEFGAFAGDDQISDEEAEFTSQYSVSPLSSEAGSDSDSDSGDVFSDSEVQNWPGRSRTDTRNDGGYDEGLHLPPPLAKGDALKQPARDPDISSPDLDYALLKVDRDDDILKGMPVLSKLNVSKVIPGVAAVTTVTGAGHLLHGKLSGRVSYVRPPNAATFQKAFVVDLNGPLHPGDCGSIVRDSTTRKLYGHIFLGSVESGMAYIMPAATVLRDIRSTFERMDKGNSSRITDAKELCMESGTTSITPTPTDSHHQLMVRRPPTHSQDMAGWLSPMDPADLVATVMRGADRISTLRVKSASMQASTSPENFVVPYKPATATELAREVGEHWHQHTERGPVLEDVRTEERSSA